MRNTHDNVVSSEEAANRGSPNTGSGDWICLFASHLTFFTSRVSLSGKWRDELAGGEVIEGAEAAAEFGVAQAAVAVQSAQRLFGGLDLSEAHRQECLCHQHLRIEAHRQDSSRRIRAMEGSCLCHWLSDLVFVAQPFLAVLPHATT